jgi:MYXO-CTERM domain-containing protein
MQQSSSLQIISVGILAMSISVLPMTLPASAQVTSPGTSTQGTTTTTYENNNDDRGLWGLTGLLGLFGLLGRRKEHTRTTTRDDATVYRDPSIR